MCGAFAMSAPSASNKAQEKSSRSRMLTDTAVAWSTAPICSATCMKRWLKSSSCAGSALRASIARLAAPLVRAKAEACRRSGAARPAGLDDGRRVRLDDECGPRDPRPARARRGRRVALRASRRTRRARGHARPLPRVGDGDGVAFARGDGLDAQRRDLRRSRRRRESEAPRELRAKAQRNLRQRRVCDLQRRLGARRAKFQCAAHAHFCRCRALRKHRRRRAALSIAANSASSAACVSP